jgi:ribosome recycling factor
MDLHTGVLLEVFRTSLSSKEKRDILVLRNVREELMLHIKNVSLDEEIYTDISNQLKEALQSLATGLEPAVQDNCRRFIARYP